MLNPMNWDVLAFLGSIIGGIITWIGVRVTINHSEKIVNRERKEKELDEAAQKTRILDNIASRLEFMQSKFSSDHWLILMHQHDENNREWIKSTDKRQAVIEMQELVNESIKVDANAYKTLLKLEKFLIKVFRKDAEVIAAIDNSPVSLQMVEEYLIRLTDSSGATIAARHAITEIRANYLRTLFPNDDPDSFAHPTP